VSVDGETPGTRSRILAFLRRKRASPAGWDPREPLLMAVGFVLLVIASFFPWWGIERAEFGPTYRLTRGVDFGVWFASDWLFIVIPPDSFYLESSRQPWWAFAAAHPEYGRYVTTSAILASMWLSSAILLVYALAFRAIPRGRARGWPSLAAAACTGINGAMIALAVLAFSAEGSGGFIGRQDATLTSWGPYLGWYAALVSFPVLALAAFLGRRVDGRLRGRCWRCFREAMEPRCSFCDAALF
jgi:hypothetical protein